MRVVGIKVDWSKYLVIPEDILETNLLRIVLESKVVDTYYKKTVTDDNVGSVGFIETSEIEGWDKTVEVVEMTEILAENNRLQRELDKALTELAAIKNVSTSTELVV